MLLRLAAAALLLCACAPAGRSPSPDRPEAEARAAVAGLAQDYEQPRNEEFFERLDSRRFPNYDSFLDAVRQFQIQNRQIVLDVVVDGVDAAGEDLGVRAHWNKSFVNPQGMHKLQNGSCELVFRRRPSGGLLLTAIQGASPF